MTTDPTPFEPPDSNRPASSAPTESELESQAIPLEYEAPTTTAHDPYVALRYRDCRLYLSGWIVSIIGAQIQSVAVGWEIFSRTQSTMSLGWVALVQAAPVMLLSIPAGQVADRLDRRRIVIATQLLEACCSIALAILSVTHGQIGWMYAILCLAAICGALGGPARSAILPTTLPTEHFSNAMTWSSSGFQVASVVGPALGGLLLLSGRPMLPYLGDAVLQVAFAAFLCVVTIRAVAKKSEPASVRTLLAGIRFVRDNPIILATISLDLFAVLLGGATYLLPAIADSILHVGAYGFGWLRAAPAVGAFVMAMVLAHRKPMQRAGLAMLWAVAGFGLATIVFGLSKNYWLSLLMLALTGAFDNVSVVVRHSLVQIMTPDEMRGRVSAVNAIFIGASNELGGFESGLTARLFGPIASVVGGGIGTLAVVAGVALIWPQVRAFGSLQQKPPEYAPTSGIA